MPSEKVKIEVKITTGTSSLGIIFEDEGDLTTIIESLMKALESLKK